MSNRQRIVLIAVAVVIAVVAFLALRPGDEDEGDSPTPAAETEQTETAPAEQEPQQTQPEPSPPEPEYTTIRVRNGKAVGGVERIEVDRGETVRLRVRSDTEDEVHVHGYDLYEDLTPERPAELRFRARIEGIFEIELHGTHEQIAELEVSP